MVPLGAQAAFGFQKPEVISKTASRTLQEEARHAVLDLRRIHKVKVVYALKKFAFPDSWRKAPINAGAHPMELSEVIRVCPMVCDFLSAYPETLLQRRLDTIYLVGSMEFYGKRYGGTNSRNALYICSTGVRNGYSREYVLGAMHHEFSSILLRSYRDQFPEKLWRAANPKGWKYQHRSGTDALGDPDLWKSDNALNKKGFLVGYSQSTLEEDFNMYATWGSVRLNKMREVALKHPRIKKKYRLIRAFYERIHPELRFVLKSL